MEDDSVSRKNILTTYATYEDSLVPPPNVFSALTSLFAILRLSAGS